MWVKEEEILSPATYTHPSCGFFPSYRENRRNYVCVEDAKEIVLFSYLEH
jgi:hypothetical protein